MFNKEAERGFSFSIIAEATSMFTTGNTSWMVRLCFKSPQNCACCQVVTALCQQYAMDRDVAEIGRANTAMVWHNNRLLALFEQDQP